MIPARAGLPLAAAAAAGALAALGQAPWSVWPLAILGLAAALLLAARDLRRAGRIGWAFGAGHHAVALQWIVEPFAVDPGVPDALGWVALAAMAGGLGAFWGAGFRLAAIWRGAPFLLGAPPILVAAEIVRMHLFTGFPWAAPGQALIGTPLMQAAALGGPHLLDALVISGAAALAAVPGRAVPAAGLGAVLAGLWVWGAARPVPDGEGPLVRLVQPSVDQLLKWQPEMAAAFTDRLIELSSGPEDAALTVWPETSLPMLLRDAGPALRRAGAAARGPLIVGANRWDGVQATNAAVLVDALGQPQSIYDKHHLVPFGEYVPLRPLANRLGLRGLADVIGTGFAPGPGPALIDVPGIGPVLPLICYESVFPRSLRGTSRPRAVVLITNDEWFGTGPGPAQHLAQARLRAAESGLPLLRAANSGITAVIDARGGIAARLPQDGPGQLVAPVPAAAAATLYARTGDWFAWIAVSLALGALSIRAIDRTRAER